MLVFTYRFFLLFSFLHCTFFNFSFAQVKIGNNVLVLEPSAALEVESQNKGFLPPRLTTAERNAITQPALGLHIFNTDFNCPEYFNGSSWFSLCGIPSCTSPPNSPSTISGITNYCPSDTMASFSISPVPNATHYVWSVPLGWTISSGAGSTQMVMVNNGIASPGTVSVVAQNMCGSSSPSSLSILVDSISASGGTISSILVSNTPFKVHSFSSNGTFFPNACLRNVEYIIIAGGGGGGQGNGNEGGGGGGAGGWVEGLSNVQNQTYSIVVGNGGAGTNDQNTHGANGQNSSAFGITAMGGGGGGSCSGSAQAGGSGGGGSGCGSDRPGGNGTQPNSSNGGFGFNGGNGRWVGNQPGAGNGGGGGGASSAGGNGASRTSGTLGGAGAGRTTQFRGTSETFAMGGNGAPGNGVSYSPIPSGTPGSGGDGANDPGCCGVQGSTGIVIIRYPE
jgi:hypothetical protein